MPRFNPAFMRGLGPQPSANPIGAFLDERARQQKLSLHAQQLEQQQQAARANEERAQLETGMRLVGEGMGAKDVRRLFPTIDNRFDALLEFREKQFKDAQKAQQGQQISQDTAQGMRGGNPLQSIISGLRRAEQQGIPLDAVRPEDVKRENLQLKETAQGLQPFDPQTGQLGRVVGRAPVKTPQVVVNTGQGEASGEIFVEPILGVAVPTKTETARGRAEGRATFIETMDRYVRSIEGVRRSSENALSTFVGEVTPFGSSPEVAEFDAIRRPLGRSRVKMESGVAARPDELNDQLRALPSATEWVAKPEASRRRHNTFVERAASEYVQMLPRAQRRSARKSILDRYQIPADPDNAKKGDRVRGADGGLWEVR